MKLTKKTMIWGGVAIAAGSALAYWYFVMKPKSDADKKKAALGIKPNTSIKLPTGQVKATKPSVKSATSEEAPQEPTAQPTTGASTGEANQRVMQSGDCYNTLGQLVNCNTWKRITT